VVQILAERLVDLAYNFSDIRQYLNENSDIVLSSKPATHPLSSRGILYP
jgi:hypothetical protein